MQKVKHLEYDHTNSMLKVDDEARRAHKEELNDHILGENIMKKEKMTIRDQINDRELSNVDVVNQLNERHRRQLNGL